MRTEVYYRDNSIDGRARKVLASLRQNIDSRIQNVAMADVYLTKDINGLTPELAAFLFSDSVAQRTAVDAPVAEGSLLPDWKYIVEVTYRPGVTNPTAITAKKSVETALGRKLGADEMIQTAVQYLIASPDLSDSQIASMQASFYNPLVQQAEFIKKEEWGTKKLPAFYPYKVASSEVTIKAFDLASREDAARKISRIVHALVRALAEVLVVRDLLDQAEYSP